jgi:hypothetical protein
MQSKKINRNFSVQSRLTVKKPFPLFRPIVVSKKREVFKRTYRVVSKCCPGWTGPECTQREFFWNTKMFLKFRCTNAQYYTPSSYNSTARINLVADLIIGDCDPACVNGGVCNNEQCFCPDGYTGKTCSDGKSIYLSSRFKLAQPCWGFVLYRIAELKLFIRQRFLRVN